jgi:DNA-binding FadR family transcriptional regulator
MTPVRDCLNRLAGERLVDMKPGEGYRVPRLGEQALRDLLDVNAALLSFALSVDAQRPSPVSIENNAQSYPDRVTAIFDAIALRSGNLILGETVRALSERSHLARSIDPQVFGDTDAELDELEQLFINGSAKLMQKLQNYHVRRRNEVATIIRLMQ